MQPTQTIQHRMQNTHQWTIYDVDLSVRDCISLYRAKRCLSHIKCIFKTEILLTEIRRHRMPAVCCFSESTCSSLEFQSQSIRGKIPGILVFFSSIHTSFQHAHFSKKPVSLINPCDINIDKRCKAWFHENVVRADNPFYRNLAQSVSFFVRVIHV